MAGHFSEDVDVICFGVSLRVSFLLPYGTGGRDEVRKFDLTPEVDEDILCEGGVVLVAIDDVFPVEGLEGLCDAIEHVLAGVCVERSPLSVVDHVREASGLHLLHHEPQLVVAVYFAPRQQPR